MNNIEILYRLPNEPKSGNIRYMCKCYCGKEFIALKTRIKNGITKSCGCENIKRLRQYNKQKEIPSDISKSLYYLYPNLITEWHKVLNTIKITQIKPGSSKKVWWKCSLCGNEWQAAVSSRVYNKTGCDKCNKSKAEQQIISILTKLKINFVQQKIFNKCKDKQYLKFDFFIPEVNLCIEYNGEQHYTGWRLKDKQKANDKLFITQYHDRIKRQYCQQNGIHLIEIPYTEFKNLELIITNIIRSFTEPIPQGNLL